MAKNREPEKIVESESDEEASSEEVDSQESKFESDSDSDSDSEPEYMQVPRKLSFSTEKKAQPQPDSEEETGSEFESESESESQLDGSDPTKKPISKPEPAAPTGSTVTKRSAEEKEMENRDTKKRKKNEYEFELEPETTEKISKKPPLFQRFWTEEDEIVILEGMIDYASKKKVNPTADLNAFHDFIKKNLHADVSRSQLKGKIRRLKKRYENNKSKENKDGKDRNFSKRHDQKVYELSKSIWGGGNVAAGGENVVATPKANGEKQLLPASKGLNYGGGGGCVSMEERIMRVGAELYEAGKGLEGEQEWKKLRLVEIELYVGQLELKVAQTKLVLDALKSAITEA